MEIGSAGHGVPTFYLQVCRRPDPSPAHAGGNGYSPAQETSELFTLPRRSHPVTRVPTRKIGDCEFSEKFSIKIPLRRTTAPTKRRTLKDIHPTFIDLNQRVNELAVSLTHVQWCVVGPSKVTREGLYPRPLSIDQILTQRRIWPVHLGLPTDA